MNLKGLLPQDVEFVKEYVDGVVLMMLGNDVVFEELEPLARCSLGRILANRIREEYPKLPRQGWTSAAPRPVQESHILDWIVSSAMDRVAWLSNVDAQARPKKLMKCSTYDDLAREADRYFEKRNGNMAKALGPDDESFLADLSNGYSIVEMLTPEALDLESASMHHCVGHGSYDARLRAGWARFLSVRDRKRRPVATVALRQEPNARWSIDQIQGKRNERPAREVMDALRMYAVDRNWWYRQYWWPVVDSSGGGEYDLDRIPEGATILSLEVNDYELEIFPDLALPAGLTVLCDADLSPRVRLPEDMTVGRVLTFTKRSEDDPLIRLPESLHAEETRVGAAADIERPIPTHLVHRIRYRVEKLTGLSYSPMSFVSGRAVTTAAL